MSLSSIKKVLVIKLSSFGDMFHPLPAVRLIKKETGAVIDWVTQPEYVELVKCFNDVSRVIPFCRRGFLKRFPEFLRDLRREHYELVLDFQGLLKSALVARSAYGDRRIGPSFHRECSSLFYHEVAGQKNKNRHAVEECLDVVRHLGFPVMPVEFPVTFPSLQVEGRPPRVALVPGTRWPSKCWPPEKFAAVANDLVVRFNASIFLFGSCDETDLCARIGAAIHGDVIDMSGRTTLSEMGSFFASMDILVSNDSGAMHMAAAVGLPVVAIFGPTDPLRTGPYGENNMVITADVECRPCFSRHCVEQGRLCMENISVEQVVSAVESVLKKH